MADSGGDIRLSEEQQQIVDDFGNNQFVSAGAGSGKTRVVIEGIISALESGAVSIDQVLAITFTEKAAGQMIKRARDRLTDKGMLEERRQIEKAHISTIHSFCSSLIRANALALRLDPQFTVADEAHATLLKEKAFTRCLEGFLAEHGDAGVEFYSEYDPGRDGKLGEIIIELHDELRSRGQEKPDIDLPGVELEPATLEFRDVLNEALTAFDDAGSGAVTSVKQPILLLLEALDEPDIKCRLRLVLEANPAKRAIKEHVSEVHLARKQYMGLLCLDKRELLRELLVHFTREYTAVKRSAALLDFEDLQLQALKLLRSDGRLCERIASGFKVVVVDEFQDTNGLQNEIVGLLARDNVCFVGDENQSIYRFRHADVDLFREKRRQFAAAGRGRPLTVNYRSQPEILTFVNHVFGADGMLGGSEYLRMESGAEEDVNGDPLRVEAIIVDNGSLKDKRFPVGITRKAEAELVARRLHELFSADFGYEPGSCVILVRKRLDAGLFSEALDRYGVPNYLSIGNDYFRKLELGDALGLLRLLVNPFDDIALLSVLRSPLVGLDDDSLIMLRKIAGSGSRGSGPPPLWPTVASERTREKLPGSQADKLKAFSEQYGGLRRCSRRQSLESTVREVIGYRDYAAIAAAGGDGRTSLANLMKLIDLAVAYEESWGRDLPAFVDFLVHQQDKDVKEGEAPTEEEGSTSVQIMTIHAAKGLEFPIVVWGYMGGRANHSARDILVDKQGRIGFKYPALDTKKSADRKLLFYDQIEDLDRRKDEEEGMRVGYVAMTRAEHHLILSGSAECLKEPGGAESTVPMDWVRNALDLGPGHESLVEMVKGEALDARMNLDSLEGCPVSLMVCNDPEALIGEVVAGDRKLTQAELEAPPADLGNMPTGASFVPASINASSISIYQKCPRRYYLEKQIHIDVADPAGTGERAERDDGRLPANQMGTLVHAVLERATFSLPISIDTGRENLDTVAADVLEKEVELTEADHERATHLLENFSQAPVAGAMAEADARGDLLREKRFLTMLGDTTILGGTMDIFCGTGEVALVVDYKTDRIKDKSELLEAAEHHAGQMAAYALAASRMQPGVPVQVVLLFLDQPGEQISHTFEDEALDAIERELNQTIASMSDGRFPPLSAMDNDTCPGCAGFAGDSPLCATASLK